MAVNMPASGVTGGVQTIRAQAKKEKAAKGSGQQGSVGGSTGGDKASANRIVTKAPLASPLTVPWPEIPRHLQKTVTSALPQLVPSAVADYHVSRQRCNRERQKLERKEKYRQDREADVKKGKAEGVADSPAPADEEMAINMPVLLASTAPTAGDAKHLTSPAVASAPRCKTKQPTKAKTKNAKAPRPVTTTPAPVAPVILNHLVLGTNEIIKALEQQTDALRLRVMMLSDALNAQMRPKKAHGPKKRKRDEDGVHAPVSTNSAGSGPVSAVEAARETFVEGLGVRQLLPTAPADVDMEAAGDEEAAAATTGSDTAAAASEAVVTNPPSNAEPLRKTARAEQEAGLRGVSNPTRTSQPFAPLQYILIPLPDINPPSLVTPIAAYCATYNTIVYQHNHILGIARTRLPKNVLDAFGPSHIGSSVGRPGSGGEGEMEEVRVVPLGRVEAEMAALVGLRRLACLGVRSSHPFIRVLEQLLPKPVLHPPRLAQTRAFATTALTVHTGSNDTSGKSDGHAGSSATAGPPHAKKRKVGAASSAPHAGPGSTSRSGPVPAEGPADGPAVPGLIPHIHYAPLHITGITTTIPADGASRKNKRLTEVRQKRREAKEKRKAQRKEMEAGILKDLKRRAMGLKGRTKVRSRAQAIKPAGTASERGKKTATGSANGSRAGSGATGVAPLTASAAPAATAAATAAAAPAANVN